MELPAWNPLNKSQSLIQERLAIKPNEEHNGKAMQGYVARMKQHHKDCVRSGNALSRSDTTSGYFTLVVLSSAFPHI